MARYLKQKLFKNVGNKMAFFLPGSIPSIRMLREKKRRSRHNGYKWNFLHSTMLKHYIIQRYTVYSSSFFSHCFCHPFLFHPLLSFLLPLPSSHSYLFMSNSAQLSLGSLPYSVILLLLFHFLQYWTVFLSFSLLYIYRVVPLTATARTLF